MSKKIRGSLSDFAAKKGYPATTPTQEENPALTQAQQQSPVLDFIPANIVSAQQNEEEYLTQLEHVIEQNIQAFYQVGSALREIRDHKLYKVLGYTRFEDYCEERWDMSRIHAYRLEAASNVIDNLKMLPNGLHFLPTSERQIRPLAALPAEQQRKTWKKVLESAPVILEKPKITAKLVEETVAIITGETKPAQQQAAKAPRKSLRFSTELDDALTKSLDQIKKMLDKKKKDALSKELIAEAILRHGLAELKAQGKNSLLWQEIEDSLNQ